MSSIVGSTESLPPSTQHILPTLNLWQDMCMQPGTEAVTVVEQPGRSPGLHDCTRKCCSGLPSSSKIFDPNFNPDFNPNLGHNLVTFCDREGQGMEQTGQFKLGHQVGVEVGCQIVVQLGAPIYFELDLKLGSKLGYKLGLRFLIMKHPNGVGTQRGDASTGLRKLSSPAW
ncbi:hypothetical protein B0H10DRAFT_1940454 [Mycena sp. CBHHK59/15]|nr:hypothetical protein B0H10DRAFT_1940454 [Mycena sp. CBHHK59/15]